MNTKAEQLLGTLVGKSPWSVWKGIGSVIVFEFGRKRRVPFGNERTIVKGTYSLWVDMAHWSFRKARKELATSDSPDKAIENAARHLERKKLTGITLKRYIDKDRVLFGVLLRFNDRHSLDAIMYVDKKHTEGVIFMLYTPTHVLQFNYQGKLSLKKLKQRSTKARIVPKVRPSIR